MQHSRHQWTRLDSELVAWGARWQPDSVQIILDAEDKKDEVTLLCALGKLAKCYAMADPDWFFRIALERPRELLELSTYIGQVVLYGHPFPPMPDGWVQWLKNCWYWPMRKKK